MHVAQKIKEGSPKRIQHRYGLFRQYFPNRHRTSVLSLDSWRDTETPCTSFGPFLSAVLGFSFERTCFLSVFCSLVPFFDRVLDCEGGNSETRHILDIVLHTLLMRLLQTDLTFAQSLVAFFTFPQAAGDVVAGVDGCKGGEAGCHEFAFSKLFASTLLSREYSERPPRERPSR